MFSTNYSAILCTNGHLNGLMEFQNDRMTDRSSCRGGAHLKLNYVSVEVTMALWQYVSVTDVQIILPNEACEFYMQMSLAESQTMLLIAGITFGLSVISTMAFEEPLRKILQNLIKT